ncbi:hypothetical protein [Streptomyces sp. NBC_01538]|uniref:hypothetical protein n=1 Tax=Streptomyces sp. NBC_01538 TaxID=2903897 RepID=UPI00386B9D90
MYDRPSPTPRTIYARFVATLLVAFVATVSLAAAFFAVFLATAFSFGSSSTPGVAALAHKKAFASAADYDRPQR